MIDGGEEHEGHDIDASDEGFKPEKLDPHLTLYQDVLDELKARVAKYIDKKFINEESEEPLKEEDELSTIFFDQGPIPLVLPTVGSDKMRLNDIHFGVNKLKHSTIDAHAFIVFNIDLYADSSPRNLEEYTNPEYPNIFNIVLGREMEPVIIQRDDPDMGEFSDEFKKARKHKLTDVECERILDLVKGLGDPDSIYAKPSGLEGS